MVWKGVFVDLQTACVKVFGSRIPCVVPLARSLLRPSRPGTPVRRGGLVGTHVRLLEGSGKWLILMRLASSAHVIHVLKIILTGGARPGGRSKIKEGTTTRIIADPL